MADDARPNLFLDACGVVVTPDPDQPGMFLWRRGAEGSDVSFPTERDAAVDAEREMASVVMGSHDISDEEWDDTPVFARVEMARDTFSESAVPSPTARR